MTTALILVDIQNDYFPGGAMELSGSVAAGRNAGKILRAAREAGILVVHIMHLSTRPGATFFLPGTPGSEIADPVRPRGSELVIRKESPNSFRNTGLLDLLREQGITDLIIAGMMTHMCIDSTCRAAADLGFSCSLVPDACATRNLEYLGRVIAAKDVHDAFIAALSGLFARIVPSDEVIRELAAVPSPEGDV